MKKKIIILSLLIVVCSCFGIVYTVQQDGSGDFTTINGAVNSTVVHDGDEIEVYPGVYNENISISKNIHLYSLYKTTNNVSYISNTIITGNQIVFTVGEFLDDCSINGFTIREADIGIKTTNSNLEIVNVIMHDLSESAIDIEGDSANGYCVYIQKSEIFDCGDGIYVESISSLSFSDINIHNNNNGIYIQRSIITPSDTHRSISKAVLAYNTNDVLYTCKNVSIDKSQIFCNRRSFAGNGAGKITIHACTITCNHFVLQFEQDLDIQNTIIYNNLNFIPEPLSAWPLPYSINYSCIPNISFPYNGGVGNIFSNPEFLAPGSDDFSLTWNETQKSPCIDAGDPNSATDPDGTRTDMGALYFDHETKTYTFEGPSGSHDGWTWLCFDVLDPCNGSVNNQVQNLWDGIKNNLDHGEHENLEFRWNGSAWQNGEHLVISPEGYKIEMTAEDEIAMNGQRCDPATTFPIYTGEDNWIGFFIGKSQHVYDAFGGYLNDITSIKHQDWSVKPRNGWWPDVPYTLSPGDMVIVESSSNISEFQWGSTAPEQTYVVPQPQNFTYTEEADYIPIYMDLSEENMPDEVAVLVDGECKGARVITGDHVDICAYIAGCQSGNVEFAFSYSGRAENVIFSDYAVLDPRTGDLTSGKIDLGNKAAYYDIALQAPTGATPQTPAAELSLSNYPNPFNPSTEISYTLPITGDVMVAVYNTRGQKVTTLVEGTQNAGTYTTRWSGTDANGKPVSSGIYYCRVTSGTQDCTRKMVLMK
jgi:hypothetical protein